MSRNAAEFLAKHDAKTIIADLKRELQEAVSRADTADAMREWIGTAKLATHELDIPKWAVAPKKAGAPGVPVVMLSDLHWGERVRKEQIRGVNEYNLAIARRRLRTVIEGAIKLSRILDPDMRYPGIVLPLGGDMISGSIHDELAATNELNTMPTLLDLYRNMVSSIDLLANTFGAVFLPCVSGNHDRDTKKTWAKDRNHTSFGWLLYQFLAVHYANDPRVTFYIPDGADAKFRVFGFNYLLTHGDEFKAGDSIIGAIGPVMRGEQKKSAAYSAVGDAYDCMIFGHWHTRMIWSRGRGNGALKGYDEFAKRNNFKPEPPSQNFWVAHPDHGITFDAPLLCEPGRRGPHRGWVSWQK